MNDKPLCIYHGNCADGFTSAWIVHRFFKGEVDLYVGTYQQPPPDAANRHVILVDFSYKRQVMLELAKLSKGVLVLDHHKSAAEDLAGNDSDFTDTNAWTGAMDWDRFVLNCYQDRCENIPVGRIYTKFDMERSGAGLVWDFFYPGIPRPSLVDHVEDRDLWRFKLPFTRQIQAAVFSYPYDLKVWDELADSFDEFGQTRLVGEGSAIERKHHKDIAELTQVVTRMMNIAGHIVPVANLPYTLTSDAGHLLCGETHPFAACYWDTPKGRVFSLRSRDNGQDVSEIAEQFGGGGHRNAAGFSVSYEVAKTFEINS